MLLSARESLWGHIILSLSGEPDPVSNLELAEQQERHVKLTWTPGDDHNSPIESKVYR